MAALEDAKTALRPVPAKVVATELDPDAKLARPHLAGSSDLTGQLGSRALM
jgi:hypothetical protein